MEQQSYSPDLAPKDFWVFLKIKSALKGRRFQANEDIKKLTTVLKDNPQQEFQTCFEYGRRG